MSWVREWWNMRGCGEDAPMPSRPAVPSADPAQPRGLFAVLRRRWRLARGHRLRLEFDDACRRVATWPAPAVAEMEAALTGLAREFARTRGHPLEMIQEDRIRLARHYQRAGRSLFHSAPPQAYGQFFFSAFLEATALPGEDAAQVKEAVIEWIAAARSFAG
ncbi:MAG: hypothetical protein HQL42_04040 [Alphaproteobacteria bacterium]|nr:hypothetical protein [Alphaproteobacteria bacterium]